MQFSRPLKKRALPAKIHPRGAFISLQDQQIETVGQLYASFRIIQTLNTYQGGGAEKRPKTARKWPEMLTKVDIKNTLCRCRISRE